MSPLWRDQLRIVLCPDKVLIVRFGRGLWPSIKSKQCIACEPVSGMPAWFAPLNTLMQWLNEEKPQKVHVVIILSNHFVRYGMLPWSAKIGNASESQAFARIHFENVYGDVAKKWVVRISDGAYEASRIASAVDREMLDSLADMFLKVSLRIIAIEPYVMSAFNAWRKHLSKASGRFLLVEPGKACLIHVAKDKCLDIKSYSLRDQLETDLADTLDREFLLKELDASEKVYVCAVEQPGLKIASKTLATWENLIIPDMRGFSSQADAQFGMACVGAL